jgi:hypothetical protein
MMVDGAEERQLKGPIDVLAPYTCDTRLGESERVDVRAYLAIMDDHTSAIIVDERQLHAPVGVRR